MRKGVILFVMAVLLIFPAAAHAQSAVAFEQLKIQLWPEYDRPAVLAIYDFTVSAETVLPAQVSLRLPAGSELLAVAKQEGGGLMNVDHQPLKKLGDDEVLSFQVVDRTQYHLEFYIQYVRTGSQRSFVYAWPGDYAVAQLAVALQEPVSATKVVIEPLMTREPAPRQDGFTYQSAQVSNVAAGQAVTYKFTYEKDNEVLSADSLGVQPTAPLDQPISGQSQFMSFLPWILGSLGVALIVGGGLWYWLSGRSGGRAVRSRKRHAAETEADDAQIYCVQCGKRAQPNDRFCRACGSKLRAQE